MLTPLTAARGLQATPRRALSRPARRALLLALLVLFLLWIPYVGTHIDLARDMFVAHRLLAGQEFPLAGPILAATIHLGPIWYYLLAGALALGGSWIGAIALRRGGWRTARAASAAAVFLLGCNAGFRRPARCNRVPRQRESHRQRVEPAWRVRRSCLGRHARLVRTDARLAGALGRPGQRRRRRRRCRRRGRPAVRLARSAPARDRRDGCAGDVDGPVDDGGDPRRYTVLHGFVGLDLARSLVAYGLASLGDASGARIRRVCAGLVALLACVVALQGTARFQWRAAWPYAWHPLFDIKSAPDTDIESLPTMPAYAQARSGRFLCGQERLSVHGTYTGATHSRPCDCDASGVRARRRAHQRRRAGSPALDWTFRFDAGADRRGADTTRRPAGLAARTHGRRFAGPAAAGRTGLSAAAAAQRAGGRGTSAALRTRRCRSIGGHRPRVWARRAAGAVGEHRWPPGFATRTRQPQRRLCCDACAPGTSADVVVEVRSASYSAVDVVVF